VEDSMFRRIFTSRGQHWIRACRPFSSPTGRPGPSSRRLPAPWSRPGRT
jgi:hypothetical protein